MNMVRPHITVLDIGQIEQIHEQTLQVLSTVGVRVDSARAQSILAREIGPAFIQDRQVRIPRQVVEWAIQAAPSTIEIYDRKGDLVSNLGDDRTRFGIGVTTLYYQDPLTDTLTPFARSHMQSMVRLGNSLPLFDFISTIGIVQDVPAEIADLYATLDMVANTTKPLVILVSEDRQFPAVLDLLQELVADLTTRPCVIPYFNPITPLIINEGTSDKMLATIERGLPFIYSNYSMAGVSTPITPAGMLIQLLAELLAGLVLSQLAKEGTPVILGMLPAFFDMKTMVNFYDPHSLLLNLACAEMMAHYRLPHCGTSGSGTGWRADLLAADTYWMNHLTSCIGKVGLCPFVGDTLTSKAFAPTTVVYAHDVIEQALRLAHGFPLDESSMALAEIVEAGPGGNFLLSARTRKLARRGYFSSRIWPRPTMEQWEAQGQPHATDLLREHTVNLIANAVPPDDHDDLMGQGEAFIENQLGKAL
jgi:trimethylamine--corrinoid protein Co-methyltransferase